MAKKLFFLYMLAALQNVVLATGDDHSLLRKRSHDEMNSSVATFERSKRQAINIKDKDDVLGENAGPLYGGKSQLLPVEDSRSRSSDSHQETYKLFKNNMSTSSNYANISKANTMSTQLCEHSAQVLNDHSNEQLETLVDSIISSRNSENSLSSVSEVVTNQSSSSSSEIYADYLNSARLMSDHPELVEEMGANSLDSLSNAPSVIEEELSQSSFAQNRSVYDDGFDSFDDDIPVVISTESIDSQDLDLFAAELLREESANQQHELPRNDRQLEISYDFSDEMSSAHLPDVRVQEDRNQERQSKNKCYFCPECLISSTNICNLERALHYPSCSLKQCFKKEDVLSIDAPRIIKHKSDDIYCLHPTKKAIYLQNSKGLGEDNFTLNADGSLTYYDGENIRVWDEFGFECDPATRERLANPLAFSTQFNVISRGPEDAKKEYFKCPMQGCRELQGNQDYDALKDHLRKRHKSKQPFICHYEGCNVLRDNLRHLVERHEVSHQGIEFLCPICSKGFSNEKEIRYKHLKKAHGSMELNTNVASVLPKPILPRNEEANLLPSVSDDLSQESSLAEILENDWLNEHQMFDELSEGDLFSLAQEVLAEEEAHDDQDELPIPDEQSMGTVGANHEHQLIRKPNFCPECLVNFSSNIHIKRIKHEGTCCNQGFNHIDVLTIDNPVVIQHCTSGDLYCLHPTKGAIYLQHSNGLNEEKVVINPDGSFTYYDEENPRLWDKFGFDDATRERFANLLETKFEIISRRPCEVQKEYFECFHHDCAVLKDNQDYEKLIEHLKTNHKGMRRYVCHYSGCNSVRYSENQLLYSHEMTHLGIDFICPFCFQSYQNLDYLNNVHIKNKHPGLIFEGNHDE